MLTSILTAIGIGFISIILYVLLIKKEAINGTKDLAKFFLPLCILFLTMSLMARIIENDALSHLVKRQAHVICELSHFGICEE